MNIGEALLDSLDGIARAGEDSEAPVSPISGYRGRRARMNALENEHGGPKGAAAAVGVQLRTWKLWKTPLARPTPASLGKLAGSVARIYRTAAVRRFLRSVTTPRVCATIRWGTSGRYYARKNDGYRCTNLDEMDGRNMTALAGPWADRDANELARRFEAAVSLQYSQAHDPIQFEGTRVTVEWQ